MNEPFGRNSAWLDLLRPAGDPVADVEGISVIEEVRSVLSESAVDWGAVIALDVAEVVEGERSSQEMLAGHAGGTGLEAPANIAALLRTLACLRTGATQPEPPLEVLRHVRAAFHQGAELSSILRFVWAHHAQVEERLLLAQRKLAPKEQDGAGLQELHARMNCILDSYVSGMVAAFEAERSNREGGSPARRRRLIEVLVAGGDVSTDAEELLGVRLRGHHLVAVAGVRQGALTETQLAQLRALGPTASASLGASGGFVQDYGESVLLCWTFPGAPADDVARGLADIDLPSWLQLSIGPVASGVEGLRLGVQGALEVRSIAKHPGRGAASGRRAEIVSYDEVGLVGLMLRDESRLIRFVEATLGGLARQSPRNEEVRATLLAFLLHGRSRKKAAETLHVAPNTVAYRVEQARTLMARDPDSDLLATLLALQVLQILPNLDEALSAKSRGMDE